MFCRRCGSKIPEGALFCPNCGLKVENTATQQDVAPAQQPAQEMPKQESVTESTPEKTVQTEQSTPKTEEKPVEQDDSSQVNVKVNTPAQESPRENTPAQSGQPQSPVSVSQTNQPNGQVLFCRRCGTKIPNGADFCPNCGFSVHGATPPPQAQTQENPIPQKKKINKIPVIIASAAVVVVAVIVTILFTRGTDFKATLRAWTPFANSQDLPYTCGEVFDKYIKNDKWNIEKDGETADVEIQGEALGTDKTISAKFHIEPDEDAENSVIFDINSVKLDDEELGSDGLFALFIAYDEKDDDLESFDILVEELRISLNCEPPDDFDDDAIAEFLISPDDVLTRSFSDDETGISFYYPDFWTNEGKSEPQEIVTVSSPRSTEEHPAFIKIETSDDIYGVFSGDEDSVREAVNADEQNEFISYDINEDTDWPIAFLQYKTGDKNGNERDIYQIWMSFTDETYVATCTHSDSIGAGKLYNPIFVNISARVYASVALSDISEEPVYSGLLIDGYYAEDLLTLTRDDVLEIYGEPGYIYDGTYNYSRVNEYGTSDGRISFNFDDEGYVYEIYASSNRCEYDGQVLYNCGIEELPDVLGPEVYRNTSDGVVTIEWDTEVITIEASGFADDRTNYIVVYWNYS